LFSTAQLSLLGQGLLIVRGFAIILRHTTLGRNSLDECLARRRGLYLTAHNTHKKKTSIWIRTRDPRKRAAQSHALDREPPGPATLVLKVLKNGSRFIFATDLSKSFLLLSV